MSDSAAPGRLYEAVCIGTLDARPQIREELEEVVWYVNLAHGAGRNHNS